LFGTPEARGHTPAVGSFRMKEKYPSYRWGILIVITGEN